MSADLVDARHRSYGTTEGSCRRKSIKRSGFTEFGTAFVQERARICKLHPLHCILLLIICFTFLVIRQSPGSTVNEPLHTQRSRLWDQEAVDSPYSSQQNVEWTQLTAAFDRLRGRANLHRIALLNFNNSEVNNWKSVVHDAVISTVYLEPASKNITWEVLYPEWIDEGEEHEVPTCPSLPEPKLSISSQFDMIAVKLPCNKPTNSARDVARLHLQISAAKLAASLPEARGPVYVLFITDCIPIPNLFRCKDLIVREANMWLYQPDIRKLRQKTRLPIGSCELAVPLKAAARLYSHNAHREAYATILHSAHIYVCGAIAAAQSIRMSGSTRDLVILVDESIDDQHKKGLEAAGWKVRTIQRIRNPKAERDAYNEWNYSKFRLWQLTDYDKIIFIDADLLVLRNIDFLFAMPEITATANNATLFNSGVMVIEPSNCTFRLLMDHIDEIDSYNGGDQGYLNEIFTWWHRIPRHMNFLKHFWMGDSEAEKHSKNRLFGARPPVLYVLHYLGVKPWLCFRDYDCNWNVDVLWEFASDVAHATWWKVHDAMPRKLQQHCLLTSKQKAALEWDRRQAAKANFSDGHWKRRIRDKRLKICFEKFCYWERMLRHWGQTGSAGGNSTDSAAATRPGSPLRL